MALDDARTQVEASPGRQLSVFLDDTPGTLAGATGLLGEAGINIRALSLAEGVGHGAVRMVVDRHADACALLRANGFLFFERDILELRVANRPGGLAEVLRRWGERGINVAYAYCAGGEDVERGLVIVRVDRAEDALAALA